MPLAITIVVSLLGGGLAGAVVSVASNRIFHWRELRTKFYPLVNNMNAAYMIRMEKPEDRYVTGSIGIDPPPENRDFVQHRSDFLGTLIEFNELKEARILRTTILDKDVLSSMNETAGKFSTDLLPEAEALDRCLWILHKKLKLDPRVRRAP